MIESGRTDVEPVLINDLGSVEDNAHLLRYDSVHGRFPGTVEVQGDTPSIITYAGRTYDAVKVTAERDPLSAARRRRCGAGMHRLVHQAWRPPLLLPPAPRKVLVSAPAEGGRRHHRLWRQPEDSNQGHDGHLERLLHHQLPRPDGQGAAREFRHRTRLHGDHPFLYRRPENRGHAAQGPASRPRRRHCR